MKLHPLVQNSNPGAYDDTALKEDIAAKSNQMVPNPLWIITTQAASGWPRPRPLNNETPASFEIEIGHSHNFNESRSHSFTPIDWGIWPQSGYVGRPGTLYTGVVGTLNLRFWIGLSADNEFIFSVQTVSSTNNNIWTPGYYRDLRINGKPIDLIDRDLLGNTVVGKLNAAITVDPAPKLASLDSALSALKGRVSALDGL